MALDNKAILLIILAIFIPPLAVFLKKETCDFDVILNLILTLFFFLPGIIHAIWVILK
jgi:uncharacterized membrane protein YqaE (UPF0057 family)